MKGFNAKMHLLVILCVACGLTSGSVLTPKEDGYGMEDNVVEGAHTARTGSSFEECLRKDSISCVQMQIFRMAKAFFDRPSIDVFNGLTLSKTEKYADEIRSLGADGNQTEEQLTTANDFEERETVLEKYISEEAGNFFEKRNLNWNMETLAKNVINAAPENLKKVVSDLVAEGRGRKKVIRMLLPFLLGLKVKFATILGLTYFGLILLAKKALVLSIISIAISAFLLLKKMFHHTHSDVYPGHGYGGWQSHSDSGHVEYAPHSSPVAHNMAYGGSKST